MTIRVSDVGPGTAVAVLEGRLDLLATLEVRVALQSAVTSGHPRLVVDLHDVPFADSSGLTALVAALRAARIAGGDLRLACPGEQVRSILAITLLDRVLCCHSSVEEALARFASESRLDDANPEPP